jgi:cysteine desulfurase/selenocysteine lyase
MAEYDKLLSEKQRLLKEPYIKCTWTINPIKYMIDKAHAVGLLF